MKDAKRATICVSQSEKREAWEELCVLTWQGGDQVDRLVVAQEGHQAAQGAHPDHLDVQRQPQGDVLLRGKR